MKATESMYAHIRAMQQKIGDEKWGRTYEKCFLCTWETTTRLDEDGTTLVFTGDIPAMWLRDSTMQVQPYFAMIGDPEVRRMFRGLVLRQARCVVSDAYANAFNQNGGYESYHSDKTEMGPDIWERKYEVDSLAAVLLLLAQYYEHTREDEILTGEVVASVRRILEVWKTEQHHEEKSPYSFERDSPLITETLQREGKGTPVGYTGMTWSGFRPSDDACTYHYLVPANIMAASSLRRLAALGLAALPNAEMEALAAEIWEGVQKFAVLSPKGEPVCAYEVDGLGGALFMDDANMPSLLSLPYYGMVDRQDPVYQNTRKMVLSPENPFYFEGKCAKGIGSPHTPHEYIWHIALAVQGLTSTCMEEKREMIGLMLKTDDGEDWMHEGFHVDDPSRYTRPWFAWANSMFCLLTQDVLS